MSLTFLKRCACVAIIASLFVCLLGVPQAALAASKTQDVLVAVQKKYESVKGLSADITQVLTNASSGKVENRTGTLKFQQPALIRWKTLTPEPELLVVGKEKVWEYFPEEETAYVYERKQVIGSKTMLRFLSGQARLDEDFAVSLVDEKGASVKLELVPNEPEPNLVQAFVWVDTQNWLLERVQLIDFFGNVNDVTMSKVQENPSFVQDDFRFTPPKGTELVTNPAQPQ